MTTFMQVRCDGIHWCSGTGFDPLDYLRDELSPISEI